MERDFVKLRNAKRYAKDNGLPSYIRGVFMSGGERDNYNVKYSEGKIKYMRGGAAREYTPLNNWSERVLIKELRETVGGYDINDGTLYLTANGRVMRNTQTDEPAALEANARYTFNKYKEMAARGEIRSNGAIAAHPKKWGIGVLFEHNRPKLTAAQAWVELTDEQQAGWEQARKALGKKSNYDAFRYVYKRS